MNIYNKFRKWTSIASIILVIGMLLISIHYLSLLDMHVQQLQIIFLEIAPDAQQQDQISAFMANIDREIQGLGWGLGIFALLILINQSLLLHQALTFKRLHNNSLNSNESHQGEPPEFVDTLTGLYTQLAVPQVLAHELARCKRAEGNATVLLMDIDQMQSIRASHDKANTQHAITHIGALLKQQSRRGDFVFRIEEGRFLIYLSECKSQFTINAAERFRNAVEKSQYEHKGKAFPLTLSIGIAASTSTHEIDKLQDMAAEALEGAKQGGGNCSVLHAPD